MDWRDRETYLQIGAFLFVAALLFRFVYTLAGLLIGF